MSEFLTGLKVDVPARDGEMWTVLAPLVYQSDVAGMTITVPEGFKTDFASVPRLPLAFWLTGGTANWAAVVHDYLYTTMEVPREVADAVLAEASKVTAVPAWRRAAMWSMVRLFGGSHWKDRAR